jgi:cytochrome P450
MMTPDAAVSSQSTLAPSAIPDVDADPFSTEFFENPHPIREVLREAGPVVHLSKWKVCAVARHAEVHAVLNDPWIFCSSRGVGLSDYAKSASAQTPPHRLASF